MKRKKTPCEFCGGEYESEYKEHRNGYCLWMEVYPDNNLISVLCQANDDVGDMIEDGIDIQMNFCPECGRDLRR